MSINGIGALDYKAAGYGTGRTKRSAAGSGTDSTEGNFAGRMGNAKTASPKVYKVYMKTDDMLYSGGNGSGLSFYIKYAESSIEDDPTVVAKGVDENGNEFEQTIHINDINPRNATMVQMRALEAYLGVDKNGGLSSLPYSSSSGNMGLYDRGNFITMFQDTIRDMNTLGQGRTAAYYRYSMQAYLDFMAKRSKSDSSYGAWNPMQDFLQNSLQGGNPLQQRLRETASAQAKENEKKEDNIESQKESESDTEIITQADGSRILMITNQIGGMKTVTSIRLSDPNPLQNDYVKKNTEENIRSIAGGLEDESGSASTNSSSSVRK